LSICCVVRRDDDSWITRFTCVDLDGLTRPASAG
jgi:hypothetical protein